MGPVPGTYHAPDDQLTLEPGFALHWQMTNCERFALQDILRRTRPEVAIEIGTYRGGSLQVISHFAQRVISVDIDPTVPERLAGKFSNVEYRVGDSKQLLPDLIDELNRAGANVGFFLIDGDHSTAGVRRDVNAVLKYRPKGRCVIIMHDSFNPACREGIRSADWSASPYVQWVDLDFIPGIYHQYAYDTADARSMWGGFACAYLTPDERTTELEVRESQRGVFEAVKTVSSHTAPSNTPVPAPGLARRIVRRLRDLAR
ncbi:MAG: class I SAM-dependent methyltransferase [Flavobacteriales bacterium]